LVVAIIAVAAPSNIQVGGRRPATGRFVRRQANGLPTASYRATTRQVTPVWPLRDERGLSVSTAGGRKRKLALAVAGWRVPGAWLPGAVEPFRVGPAATRIHHLRSNPKTARRAARKQSLPSSGRWHLPRIFSGTGAGILTIAESPPKSDNGPASGGSPSRQKRYESLLPRVARYTRGGCDPWPRNPACRVGTPAVPAPQGRRGVEKSLDAAPHEFACATAATAKYFWRSGLSSIRGPPRLFGTLPMRGSLAATSSQARRRSLLNPGASTGRTCQPVTLLRKPEWSACWGTSRRRLS